MSPQPRPAIRQARSLPGSCRSNQERARQHPSALAPLLEEVLGSVPCVSFSREKAPGASFSAPSPPLALSPRQVLGIHLNKWRLDRKLGIYVLVLYAVFLCFSIMIEFNVFTFVNLPMCQEDD